MLYNWMRMRVQRVNICNSRNYTVYNVEAVADTSTTIPKECNVWRI